VKPKVDLLERIVCYEGFFRLERYRLRHTLFDGGWSAAQERELLVRGRVVAVLPYDPELDRIVLIEQFRIGALRTLGEPWLIEIVAGIVEEGETPDQVARRETWEEAGCKVHELLPIFEYLLNPGISSEWVHFYCARVNAVKAGGIHGLAEEGEDIKVHLVPVDEALALLHAGKINSALPIIALQWLALHRAELRARWSAT
jgi:nudix-type nucleoside diphosphatase, YffH/AdpP family